MDLLHEVTKKDNCQLVAEKMAKTLSLRRQEVICEAPAIKDFKERWPALFDATQINEEFKRITATSLESTFMAKLDYCTPKLMNVVSSRGGAAGMRIKQIKDMLLLHNTIETRREVAIRCLIVYLGEREEDLFKEFNDLEMFEAELDMQIMKIAIIRNQPTSVYDYKTATILVEGTKILERYNISRCCAMLMGIIYALNLCYPKELKYTFEVFQKLFLELDGMKACSKVMSLKHSIF
ncbi:uncharacterized protein [Aquarana catesbeiana]|uniref:uncharacterized protein n=1 Tax=Aquarana catesbeiana TaxID=8400 RepID=UPI003CC94CDE